MNDTAAQVNRGHAPDSNEPASKNPLAIGVIGSTLALIVILTIVVLFRGDIQNILSPKPSPSPQPPKTMTGLEIAKQTATFLDKSVTSDGRIIAYTCEKQPKLDDPCIAVGPALPTIAGHVALAYWELYKRTRQNEYKEKAEQIINNVVKKCGEIAEYCLGSLPALYSFYQDTKDPRYKESALKAQELVLSDTPLPEYIILGSGAGGSILLYNLTGDTKYFEKMEQTMRGILDKELDSPENATINREVYKEGELSIRHRTILATALSYPEAYVATQNLRYLQAMEEYFKAMNIRAHLEDFKKDERSSDLPTLTGLLALSELAPLPQKNEYRELAHWFAQEMLLSLWDNPENKKFNGDFGFITFFGKDREQKRTVQSALRLLLYLKMDNELFKIQP